MEWWQNINPVIFQCYYSRLYIAVDIVTLTMIVYTGIVRKSSECIPLDRDLPIALIGLILLKQATPVDPYRPLYSCNEIYTLKIIFLQWLVVLHASLWTLMESPAGELWNTKLVRIIS